LMCWIDSVSMKEYWKGIAKREQIYVNSIHDINDGRLFGIHTATHPNCNNISYDTFGVEVALCDKFVAVENKATQFFAFPFGEFGKHWGVSHLQHEALSAYSIIFTVGLAGSEFNKVFPRFEVPTDIMTESGVISFVEDCLWKTHYYSQLTKEHSF